MFPITVAILLAVALAFFAQSAFRWIRIIRSGQPDARLDHIGRRLGVLFKLAFAQYRILKGDLKAGLMHAVIFWGFCVVSLRTILLFGMGFDAGFGAPLLETFSGQVYTLVLNIFELLVLMAILYGTYRRVVVKPKRLTLSAEAVVILVIIGLLMITDFLFDGSHFALGTGGDPAWAPISSLVGQGLAATGLSLETLGLIGDVSFLTHLILILAFLNFLPFGKHFHVFTFLPNVFFMRTTPLGQLRNLNLEDPNATSFGSGKLTDLSWKDLLDVATCTECGRCSDNCPAFNTGKILSPKQINIDMRHHVRKENPLLPWVRASGDGSPAAASGEAPAEQMGGPGREQYLAPDIIDPEVFWSCTTCRACEEACPVGIEFVDRIVGVRRHMVLTQGVMPAEVQATFRNIETNSNPWGISFNDRAEWCKGLGVRTFAEHPEAEYLYFVGCAGSFDERSKKVACAFVKVLQKAGIDFAILGKEEVCTGDSARRIGNEYLFQTLAKQNIETFNRYKVRKILTACPHCFNTIKNEYPQFGGNYEVIHHTDFINSLIRDGKLKAVRPLPQKVTYHDSCYLGRYNEIYASPREILKSIPGTEVVDVELSRDKGRCCGAGGGRMWMEERVGIRVNHKRLEDLQTANPNVIASACPFCLTMMSDATRDKGVEEKIETKDVVELLAESLA